MTSAKGGDMASKIDQTAEVLGHAQEQASSLVGMASQQATSQIGVQKDRAASTLGIVASALQEASRQMRQQDETAMAGYIDAAAGQVEHLATMLREQDINQIINTTAQFARRQPALFLAGAFALGFIGTRFLKSSSSSREQGSGYTGYESSSEWNRYSQGSYGSGSWNAGSGSTSGFNSGLGSSGAMGSAKGSRGTVGSGSGVGSAGTGSGSDWASRDSASLGPEGS
jgi:hypothetical protein